MKEYLISELAEILVQSAESNYSKYLQENRYTPAVSLHQGDYLFHFRRTEPSPKIFLYSDLENEVIKAFTEHVKKHPTSYKFDGEDFFYQFVFDEFIYGFKFCEVNGNYYVDGNHRVLHFGK